MSVFTWPFVRMAVVQHKGIIHAIGMNKTLYGPEPGAIYCRSDDEGLFPAEISGTDILGSKLIVADCDDETPALVVLPTGVLVAMIAKAGVMERWESRNGGNDWDLRETITP